MYLTPVAQLVLHSCFVVLADTKSVDPGLLLAETVHKMYNIHNRTRQGGVPTVKRIHLLKFL
jgi:hypothetical protein